MLYTGVRHASKIPVISGLAFIALLVMGWPLHAEDPGLSTAGAGFAPIDARKAKDPTVAISDTQRVEFSRQFKGLVAMGLSAQSYSHWGGQSMADCEEAKGSGQWCRKCQIDMPDAHGIYYFYPAASESACTLQQVDIHVHSADEAVLKDLRPSLQDLLGRGAAVQGGGRHWDTGRDVADLYLEKQPASGEPAVRFVWSRPPFSLNHPNSLARSNFNPSASQ